MQRAGPDTATRLPTAPTRTRSGREIAMNEPPSVGTRVGVVAGVIIFAFVLASDALYGRIGFLKGKS